MFLIYLIYLIYRTCVPHWCQHDYLVSPACQVFLTIVRSFLFICILLFLLHLLVSFYQGWCYCLDRHSWNLPNKHVTGDIATHWCDSIFIHSRFLYISYIFLVTGTVGLLLILSLWQRKEDPGVMLKRTR